MALSKNGVSLVAFVLSLIGVNVAESDLMTTINVVIQVVSAVGMMVNQFKRGDVEWFIFKK